MARAMGEDVEEVSEERRSFQFLKGLEKLLSDIGLGNEKLSLYGMKASDIEELAQNSFYTMGGLYDLTPIKMTKDDVVAIYRKAFS